MIPTTLNEETDDRVKNVVRYILAGFSTVESKTSGNRRRTVASAAAKSAGN